MDITDTRVDPLPQAGKLRFINDGNVARLLDSNGRKYRVRPEAGTPIHATYGSETITLAGRAVADQTITVGGVTYTWKTSVTAANQVKVGASTAAHDILALVAAINASTSTTLYGAGTVANPIFSAADGTGDTVTLTARALGPIPTPLNSETMTNAAFGSFTDGTWATEGSAGDKLFDDGAEYEAVTDVAKTSTSGWMRSFLSPLTGAWDDLRFPASGINPPGAASDPGRSTTTGMLEFSGTADNIIAGVAQMPHAWERGTAIRPHIHLLFPTSTNNNTRWKLEVNTGDHGSGMTNDYGTWTDVGTITITNPADVRAEVIHGWGDVDMSAFLESAIVMWKVSRLAVSDAADNDTSAVVLLELDFHYQVGKSGTETEIPA